MMRLLYKLPFPDLILQMMRFGITGVMATLMHFSVVVVLVETAHLQPLIANIYGFLSGFIISFTGHRFWTFSNTTQSVSASLPRFFFIAAINFIGNQSLYYFLLEKLHVEYMIALVVVLGIMAVITFLLSKFWAFR